LIGIWSDGFLTAGDVHGGGVTGGGHRVSR
jgi:hypothetical protein